MKFATEVDQSLRSSTTVLTISLLRTPPVDDNEIAVRIISSRHLAGFRSATLIDIHRAREQHRHGSDERKGRKQWSYR